VQSRELDLLDICLPHLSSYAQLPLHHRDPFDRLIIAQAQVDRLPVLTADKRFPLYKIDTVW